MNQIKILFLSEQLIPSSIISIVKPFLKLQKEKKLKFTIRYTKYYKEKDIEACDIIVLCRIINPSALNIVEAAKKHQKKIIYDIDDNFFELPTESAIGKFHRHPMHIYTLTEMLKNADAVRVYSHPMQEIAAKYNPNVFLVKSYFDFSMLNGINPAKHDKLRIVYATSRGKGDNLAKIYLPAIARILEEFENRVEFYAYGQIPDELKDYKNAYKLNYEPNYTKFIKSFYSHSFDIGLAPLINDRFHNSKTNNKFREYGAMGVCGVYSNAQIYSECVENTENGMLVDNTTEDWYNAIRQIIIDDELRERIKKNAKISVKTHYSMENTQQDWQRIIDSLCFSQTGFNNILRLNVGIAVDNTYQFTNLRYDQLWNVLAFLGINYDIVDYNTLRKKDVIDKDIVICFINDNKDIEFLADKFFLYGQNNLIFDTMRSYDEPEKYPSVIFTNSKKNKAENVFPIICKGKYDQINLFQYTDFHLFSKDDGYDIDYVEEYCNCIEKVKKYIDQYYSDENSMFLWANLLSRYKGTYYIQRTMLCKINNKILKLFAKASQKIDPIIKKFDSFTTRCRFFIKFWGDYFKINIFKKY